MQSHELLKEVLKRTSAKQIAADMNLSLSLIYKWAEPPAEGAGSGASNPLDRIAQLIGTTGDVRIAQWVCEQSGGFFIANSDAAKVTPELAPATSGIVHEFADMLSVIATTSADQKVTPEEAELLRNRWERLKSMTEGFVRAAEKGSYGSK